MEQSSLDQLPQDPLVKLVVLFLTGQFLLICHLGGINAAMDKLSLVTLASEQPL